MSFLNIFKKNELNKLTIFLLFFIIGLLVFPVFVNADCIPPNSGKRMQSITDPCEQGDTCCNDYPCESVKTGEGWWNVQCAENAPPIEILEVEDDEEETPTIVPELSVQIPGFKGFTIDVKKGDVFEMPWIGEYVVALYRWAVTVISILAVVMIVIAGAKWMLAAGNASKIGDAKDGIKQAMIGLLLVLGTNIILGFINPELVIFRPFKVIKIERIDIEEDGFLAVEDGYPWCPQVIEKTGNDCLPADIVKAGRSIVGMVSGPCHCACFVANALRAAGCDIGLVAGAGAVNNWARDNGWIENNEPMAGDILVMKGESGNIAHVGICTGSGVVESSPSCSRGSCGAKATSCSNVWHGLNNSNGARYWNHDAGGTENCNNNQGVCERGKDRIYSFFRAWRAPAN